MINVLYSFERGSELEYKMYVVLFVFSLIFIIVDNVTSWRTCCGI